MKKTIYLLALLLALPLAGFADVTVKLPANSGIDSLMYHYAPVAKLLTARTRADRGLVDGVAQVKDGVAEIPTPDVEGGVRYGISLSRDKFIDLWMLPGENVTATIESLKPFNYTLTGTDFAEGISEVNKLNHSLEAQMKAQYGENPTPEQMRAFQPVAYDALKKFFHDNIDTARGLPALMALQGDDYLESFGLLPESAKSSIVYPLLVLLQEQTAKQMELEKQQARLTSGEVDAPAFTLDDVNGKPVSLSDFKGKWVVLDFWGSWCPWCIKGFPELKEAYAKYAGRLEVIGIDCRESKDAWLAGVKKYELPWVNVYNPEGSSLVNEYGVQGFPTKAIVDPEGKIRDITVGHDPSFFTRLASLIEK